MDSGNKTRLFFVVGSGRCGSTMTQEVLARHPDAGFLSNVDAAFPALNLKGRWNNGLYALTPQAFTQRDRRFARFARLPVRFGPSEGYALFSRHISPLLSESSRDLTAEDVTPWLRERTRRFFLSRADAQKKGILLCKLAGWPRARFLHEIFPEAKFLHVVRDGRAVADSLMRRPWWRGYKGPGAWQYGSLPEHYERAWKKSGNSFVVLAGIQWMIVMDAFEAARVEVGDDRWMQVRYEDLVADPRSHFGRIIQFAGLGWDEHFESRFRRFEFMPERSDAYKEGLTGPQVRALDDVLRQHLQRLGYKTEPHSEPKV